MQGLLINLIMILDLNNWPGKERREPEIYSPAYPTLTRIVDCLKKEIEGEFFEKVLDFGCGEKPYFPFFEGKFKEYIGVDISDSPVQNKSADYTIKQGERLSFAENSFDFILSTQVFEHLENPQIYANELYRVLKGGKTAFISAAFCWEFHPYPNDYWRITPDAYKALFKNFSSIEIIPDLDTLSSLMQNFNLLFSRRFIGKYPKMTKIFTKFLNKIIVKRFRKSKQKDFLLPGNYFIYLKK